jgi:hypothetical protein
VRDKFKPSEGESWILLRVELDKEVSKAKEDMQMSFLIEDLSVVKEPEYVDKDTVVRLLIEFTFLSFVIFI